jgi:uncharacterized protein YqhQ
MAVTLYLVLLHQTAAGVVVEAEHPEQTAQQVVQVVALVPLAEAVAQEILRRLHQVKEMRVERLFKYMRLVAAAALEL